MLPGYDRPRLTLLLEGRRERGRWDRATATGPRIEVTTDLRDAASSAAVIADVAGHADPASVVRSIPRHPGQPIIAVVDDADDLAAQLKAAGAALVVATPEAAVIHGIMIAAAARLHDGPVQSLTAARLQLGMAAQDRGADRATLDAIDDALETAATELSGVVDALRSVARHR
jgi:signal transduction histidine kinase